MSIDKDLDLKLPTIDTKSQKNLKNENNGYSVKRQNEAGRSKSKGGRVMRNKTVGDISSRPSWNNEWNTDDNIAQGKQANGHRAEHLSLAEIDRQLQMSTNAYDNGIYASGSPYPNQTSRTRNVGAKRDKPSGHNHSGAAKTKPSADSGDGSNYSQMHKQSKIENASDKATNSKAKPKTGAAKEDRTREQKKTDKNSAGTFC